MRKLKTFDVFAATSHRQNSHCVFFLSLITTDERLEVIVKGAGQYYKTLGFCCMLLKTAHFIWKTLHVCKTKRNLLTSAWLLHIITSTKIVRPDPHQRNSAVCKVRSGTKSPLRNSLAERWETRSINCRCFFFCFEEHSNGEEALQRHCGASLAMHTGGGRDIGWNHTSWRHQTRKHTSAAMEDAVVYTLAHLSLKYVTCTLSLCCCKHKSHTHQAQTQTS